MQCESLSYAQYKKYWKNTSRKYSNKITSYLLKDCFLKWALLICKMITFLDNSNQWVFSGKKKKMTNFHGMDLIHNKTCSVVKDWQTLIEGHGMSNYLWLFALSGLCWFYLKMQEDSENFLCSGLQFHQTWRWHKSWHGRYRQDGKYE